jgi:hypothetical protein
MRTRHLIACQVELAHYQLQSTGAFIEAGPCLLYRHGGMVCLWQWGICRLGKPWMREEEDP